MDPSCDSFIGAMALALFDETKLSKSSAEDCSYVNYLSFISLARRDESFEEH